MSSTTSDSRSALMRWGALALVGAVAFVAFLSVSAGARLDVATGGLVVGGASLVFSLATLFKMVQVLSRPRPALGLSSRGLGGASRSELREEKRRLLRAIKELKFDFEMGKLSEADFTDVKQTYELRAIEVMRQLDGVRRVHPEVYALLEERGLTDVVPEGVVKADDEPKAPAGEADGSAPESADAAKADDGPAPKSSPAADDGDGPAREEPAPEEDEGEDDAAGGHASAEAPTKVCGSCSGANDPDAKFCKHCGEEMSA